MNIVEGLWLCGGGQGMARASLTGVGEWITVATSKVMFTAIVH